MKKEIKVKCEVENCKYNEDNLCDLDELEISCIGNKGTCKEKEETICKSFELEHNIVEEFEYDILETDEYKDINNELYLEEDI